MATPMLGPAPRRMGHGGFCRSCVLAGEACCQAHEADIPCTNCGGVKDAMVSACECVECDECGEFLKDGICPAPETHDTISCPQLGGEA